MGAEKFTVKIFRFFFFQNDRHKRKIDKKIIWAQIWTQHPKMTL